MESTVEHTKPEIKEMLLFKTIMGKLATLDEIDHRVKSMETDIKEMKESLNFVYEKINDLKEHSLRPKKNDLITDKRIETLEELNATLQSRVIDLQQGQCVII